MRCSSCEPMLDGYREGTLSPRETAGVARHIRTCAACTALLEELKVVDALLSTVTPVHPAVNFTFAVMAHVRAMPAPNVGRLPLWAIAAVYVAAAWALAGAWLVGSGTGVGAAVQRALAPFSTGLHAFASTATSASHAIGSNSILIGTLLAVVIALDLLALAGIFYFYRSVRPRLLAVVTAEARS